MSNDLTFQLISLALDASLMREEAIAKNIANVNTFGYKPLQVNFEQQLKERLGFELHFNEVKPVYEISESTASIDEQMALSVKNATQYRALIKGLNHKLAIMKLALQGNNAS